MHYVDKSKRMLEELKWSTYELELELDNIRYSLLHYHLNISTTECRPWIMRGFHLRVTLSNPWSPNLKMFPFSADLTINRGQKEYTKEQKTRFEVYFQLRKQL